MNTYNTGKMRSCASDIRTKMKSYNEAKTAIDDLVTNLRNNWKDNVNTSYSQKYNAEAKVAAENVAKLMEQFAKLLETAAEGMEKVLNQAQQDINGN